MKKTERRMEFKFRFQAWEALHSMFPDILWEFDESASKRAGYNVFRDKNNFYNYVCDLGDRYELNLKHNNQTLNFWYGRADKCSVDVEFKDIEQNNIDKPIESDVISVSQDAVFYVRAALAKMASDFITLAISEGKYETSIDNAIKCLSLINQIKVREGNANDHK